MRICELFAGVGGFRVGLEPRGWEVVWSNQWEPGEKAQWASRCYVSHFGDRNHVNQNIARVPASEIPDHDLLVGGFPCQDYSVATTNAQGIRGKKGVLWWEIYRVLREKLPRFVLLENVDRLLRSPSTQRGRDFAVMLWCLDALGYVVEWRVLNAADCGAPQKRRRLFILATRSGTRLSRAVVSEGDLHEWLQKRGFFANSFPVVQDIVHTLVPEPPHTHLYDDIRRLSDGYKFDFLNAGVMVSRDVWTVTVKPRPEPLAPLRSILQADISEEFFVPASDLPRWRYLKGAKSEKRQAPTGFRYSYSEGSIPFPDRLDQPARTILTKEGGLAPSRFKHIIIDPQTRRYRVLTPVECERLNQFPDGWTEGMPTGRRYFCMGNALVVGLVERMGQHLVKWASLERAITTRPARVLANGRRHTGKQASANRGSRTLQTKL